MFTSYRMKRMRLQEKKIENVAMPKIDIFFFQISDLVNSTGIVYDSSQLIEIAVKRVHFKRIRANFFCHTKLHEKEM